MGLKGLVGGGCDAVGDGECLQHEEGVEVVLPALEDGLSLVFDDEKCLFVKAFHFDKWSQLLAKPDAVGFPCAGQFEGVGQ